MTTHTTDIDLSFDMQTRFARAVAAPVPRGAQLQVLEIDGDNQGQGWHGWSHAVAQQPYAVRLTDGSHFHTVAFDLDAKRGVERVEFEVSMLERLLIAAGINYVVAASGPAGGRHILFTVGGGGIKGGFVSGLGNRLLRLGLATLDTGCLTNQRTGAIRPPGSPHRSHGRSRLLCEPHQGLAILERRNHPDRVMTLLHTLPTAASQLRPLNQKPTSPLRCGQRATETRSYASGSDEVQAIATRFANQSSSYAEFLRQVQGSHQSEAVRNALEKRSHRPDWLQHSFTKAQSFVRENPSTGRGTGPSDQVVIQSWEINLPRVEAALSPSVRKVAWVFLAMARDKDRKLIGLSVRQIAAAANLKRGSAHRAKHELVLLGLLEKASGDQRSAIGDRYRLQEASLWQVVAAGTVSQLTPQKGEEQTVPPTTAALQLATDLASEIWSSPGLGESTRFTYLLLAKAAGDLSGPGTLTVAQLAAATGRSERTARRHLTALGDAGLARAHGHSEWGAEVRDTDELAEHLGVLGQAERHREDLRREQIKFAVGGVVARLCRRFAEQVEEERVQLADHETMDNETESRSLSPSNAAPTVTGEVE